MPNPPIGDHGDSARQERARPPGGADHHTTERGSPPSLAVSAPVEARHRRRSARALQLVSLALLAAVVLVIAASAAAARRQVPRRTHASTASTATAQVTITSGMVSAENTPTAVSPHGGPPIGPIPTTCGASPTADPVGPPTIGRAVGAGPVWVDGFDGGAAIIHIARHATGTYTSNGWPVPIALAFKRPFSATVTVDAEVVPGFAPLWFSFQGPNGGTSPSAGFTLDPQHDQNLSPSWDDTATFWFGTLFLPGAGCYALDANWSSGSWSKLFAAGE